MGKLDIHEKAVALAHERSSEVLRYILNVLPSNLDLICECNYCLLHAAYTFNKRMVSFRLHNKYYNAGKVGYTSVIDINGPFFTDLEYSYYRKSVFKKAKDGLEAAGKVTLEHVLASKDYIGRLPIDSLERLVKANYQKILLSVTCQSDAVTFKSYNYYATI